ncbi:PqqD family protein [Bacillus sp. OTU2372]|uniref:PqqD family protein n=1 Tax=Bacillus sp. OTU2372 TaxID=3043858 RepID=UPI00313B6E3E
MITQYIQKGTCEATELDGEWVILDTDQYTITKLNDLGGFCWSMLNRAQTAETLTQEVVEKFSVSESQQQVKQDMEEFLKNLAQCGLIQHAN